MELTLRLLLHNGRCIVLSSFRLSTAHLIVLYHQLYDVESEDALYELLSDVVEVFGVDQNTLRQRLQQIQSTVFSRVDSLCWLLVNENLRYLIQDSLVVRFHLRHFNR